MVSDVSRGIAGEVRDDVIGIGKSKVGMPKSSRPAAAILPRLLSKTEPLPERVMLPDAVATAPTRLIDPALLIRMFPPSTCLTPVTTKVNALSPKS